MSIAFTLAALAALVYVAWGLLTVLFRKNKKRILGRSGLAAIAFFGLAFIAGNLQGLEARNAGFLDYSDMRSAEEAGITDPTEWAEVRVEKLAEQAEAKARAEAEAKRRAEAKAKATAAAERTAKANEDAECRSDLHCWGERVSYRAEDDCSDVIERFAKYDFEWTDGLFNWKFSRYRWQDINRGIVTIIGDEVKFQNGFGAWQTMLYECDVDPATDRVFDVRVRPGRL